MLQASCDYACIIGLIMVAGNAEACPGVKMDRAAPQFDVVPGCSTIFMLQTLRINMDTIGGLKFKDPLPLSTIFHSPTTKSR